MSNTKFTKKDLLIYFVSIIHFLFVFYIIDGFSLQKYFTFDTFHKYIFISTKIITMVLIFLFYKFIYKIYNAFKNRDENFIFFVKHSIIYFAISLFIMLITWPVFSVDCYNYIEDINIIQSYELYYPEFIHFLTGYIYIILYNIAPNIIMIPVISMFIFSLIFGYILLNTKKIISQKFAYILYIPFCFPLSLFYNYMACKHLYIGWFSLFIFAYILFNEGKLKKFGIETILIAFVLGISASYRIEYLTVFLIIPFMIMFLKVFTKKTFLIFLMIYFLSFSLVEYNQRIFSRESYMIHNLMFLFKDYINQNQLSDTEQEESEIVLKKVLKHTDYKNVNWMDDYIIDNKNDLKEADKYLFKFIINHLDFYIINNIKDQITENSNDLTTDNIYKDKLINILTLNTDKLKYTKVFFILYTEFIMLLILFITGFIYKKYFYVWHSVIHIILFSFTLIFMPVYRYTYILPYILSTNTVFFIMLIHILESRNKKLYKINV